jgi:hypothetical protein
MRTTSHARLRARNNYYTSSALIGGKGGAGPSSLYTTLEGPTEVTWPLFKILSLGGRPNTKPGDRGTLNAHNRWFILFRHV